MTVITVVLYFLTEIVDDRVALFLIIIRIVCVQRVVHTLEVECTAY